MHSKQGSLIKVHPCIDLESKRKKDRGNVSIK